MRMLAAGIAALAMMPTATTAAWPGSVGYRETTLRTPDGYAIRVLLSRRYRFDLAAEQDYVDFLGSLPHGHEMRRLGGLQIDTPQQVRAICGAGALACYERPSQVIVVPGRPPFRGAPVRYAIAHEYAHHVAAHRRNPLGSAELLGPEHWSEQEHVCRGLAEGWLKPHAERPPGYFDNPGEAWAEAYAQYAFPHTEPWRFDARLAPGASRIARAVRADVRHPWDGSTRTEVSKRRLSRMQPSLQTRRITHALDGRITVRVVASRGLVYRLTIAAGHGRPWSRDARGNSVADPRMCADGRPLRAVLRRIRGGGRATVRVTVPVAGKR